MSEQTGQSVNQGQGASSKEGSSGFRGFISKITPVKAGIAAAVCIALIAASIFGVMQATSTWIAKIDGKKITLSEFNDIFYAHQRMAYPDKSNSEIDKIASNPMEAMKNPLLNKSEFLNQLISSRVIFLEADKEGYNDRFEVKTLADVQMQNIAVEFFFNKTLKDKVAVSDKEVEDAYQQYQSQLKGMPIDEALGRIKSQIQQQKMQTERNKAIEEMRESVKIERDEIMIAKMLDSDKTKRPTSGKLVKIVGNNFSTSIDAKTFSTLYYAQNKIMTGEKTDDAIDKLAADPVAVQQNPSLSKKDFLEQIIRQNITYECVAASGTLNDKDLKTLTKLMREQFIGLYYIKESFAKELEISKQAIEAEYNIRKAQFPPNVTPDMAEAYIRSRLEQQKLGEKFPEIKQKIRERYLVEKNDAVIKSLEPKYQMPDPSTAQGSEQKSPVKK